MWGAYNGIAAQGFQHDVFNHQYNFFDPNTGVTTNHAEAMWQRAKAKFKSMFGPSNRDIVPELLGRFHVEPKSQGTFLFPLLDSS